MALDPVAFKEAQRTDWQTAAPGWRKWYDVLEAGGETVARTLVDLAAIGPGDTVLDVATGYGEPALTAARIVGPAGRVVAVDIAADMLAFGRERAAHAGLANVEFVEADAEALSFEAGSFDAVLCRQGLQFLPGPAGALERFHGSSERAVALPPPCGAGRTACSSPARSPSSSHELELPAPPPGRARHLRPRRRRAGSGASSPARGSGT